MKSKNILIIVCAAVCLAGACSSPSKKVDGTRSRVTQVVDGKTVQLQNGLKVELLGIKGSEHTKRYLEENVKGKMVTVISDSHQKKQQVKSFKTQVRAYLKVSGEGRDVAGKMLEAQVAELNTAGLKDSLESFSSLSRATGSERGTMSETELATYMMPATFYIETSHGSGTGFFIDKYGKALTCNHVLSRKDELGTMVNARVKLFGPDGSINNLETYPVSRILFSYNDGNLIDFTVFQVQLDNGMEVKYLPLASGQTKMAERIAKMGCPQGMPAAYGSGNFSAYYDGGCFMHNIPTTNGDSGAPIVNLKGEAIGIVQSALLNLTMLAKYGVPQEAQGMNFAVDATLIRHLLDDQNISYGR